LSAPQSHGHHGDQVIEAGEWMQEACREAASYAGLFMRGGSVAEREPSRRQ
jgi:hypothetical protein